MRKVVGPSKNDLSMFHLATHTLIIRESEKEYLHQNEFKMNLRADHPRADQNEFKLRGCKNYPPIRSCSLFGPWLDAVVLTMCASKDNLETDRDHSSDMDMVPHSLYNYH